jgi:hypothetical protein
MSQLAAVPYSYLKFAAGISLLDYQNLIRESETNQPLLKASLNNQSLKNTIHIKDSIENSTTCHYTHSSSGKAEPLSQQLTITLKAAPNTELACCKNRLIDSTKVLCFYTE